MSKETVHSSLNGAGGDQALKAPTGAVVPSVPATPMTGSVKGTERPSSTDAAPASSVRPPLFTIFEAVKKTSGKRGCKAWAELFETPTFKTPSEFAEKKMIGGWSPALFKGDKRNKGNVESVTALVLDYDAKLTNTTVAEAAELWGDYAGAIHTTWSSTPERPCFRVILPFTRPVTPEEYPAVWTWARNQASAVGHQLDEQTKDASRLWFLPGVRPGARSDYQLVLLTGRALDADRVLAEIAATGQEMPAQPEPICGEGEDPSSVSLDLVLARAKAYLAKIPPAIEGQGGSRQTFMAVLAMVRGFSLPEQDALDLLLSEYNPRCQPPWEAKELERKVRDAEQSAIPAGYLLKKRALARAVIRITTDQHDVIEKLEAVMAKAPDVYQRAGGLVTAYSPSTKLGTLPPQISELPPDYLGPLSTRFVSWVRPVEKDGVTTDVPAHPPVWAIKGLSAMGRWPSIPALEGVVEFPVLRPDGSVVDAPGYDPATGLLYLAEGSLPQIPSDPTLDDARCACTRLKEALCDFPFADDACRSAALAALLTPLVRYALSGHVPIIVVDKNTRGTGGSLLVDVISTILTGRPMPRSSQAEDEAEERKRITTLLLAGDPLVLIDNVGSAFGSAALDALITGPAWKDRLLGGNEQVSIPNRAVWFATGNNVVFARDTARRCLRVRLSSPLPNPEEREDFKHPRLLAWVREERGKLLSAALTVLRAFVVAGRPQTKLPPWGSFEEWSAIIRAGLVWSGEPDPGLARGAADESIDTDAQTLSELLLGWDELDSSGGGLTARDAVARLVLDERAARDPVTGRVGRPLNYQRLRDLFAAGNRLLSPATISSKYLRRFKDRVWNGMSLRARMDRTNTSVWSVVKVSAVPGPASDSSDAAPADPPATRGEGLVAADTGSADATRLLVQNVLPQPFLTPESEEVRVVNYDDMLS